MRGGSLHHLLAGAPLVAETWTAPHYLLYSVGDRPASAGWSAAEQSGAAAADEAVRQGLAEGNIAYEKHFGHVFLICASGLSGQEMLNQLRTRLKNDPQTERAVVRQELLKITQLRLAKLLSP